MPSPLHPHTFLCVDAHTCGNPVRVVAGGGPVLPAVDMAAKRQLFLAEHDWVRRALMFEPRGHDVMSGSILYPPTRPDGDLGVLFIEVSGCLPMCGHGAIGTVTVAIEEGFVTPREEGRLALEVRADAAWRTGPRSGRASAAGRASPGTTPSWSTRATPWRWGSSLPDALRPPG